MIPHEFHFVFGLRPQTEPFHLMHYLCLASCLEVNAPANLHFHYEAEPWGPWWERIRPRLLLHRIERDAVIDGFAYEDPLVARYRYAHLADFARLEILLRHGGIYADIDTLFLRPLPREWLRRRFVLGREKAPPAAGAAGSLCNAWIAAEPGAAFARLWLDEMRRCFDGSWSGHSTLLPQRLATQHPELVDIEPEPAFYACDWTPAGIDSLFLREVQLPDDARSLHLWEHLWFDRARRDFSVFHGGRLTLEYVAFAASTYARHARRFLPPDVAPSRRAWAAQQLRSGIVDPLRHASSRLARAASAARAQEPGSGGA